MRRGYARVSTKRQELALQLDALRAAGCEVIYTDKMTGTRNDRPELERCVSECEPGDVVVVYKLDRFARSTAHLVTTVYALGKRDIGFQCTTEPAIDTTTSMGRFIFTIFAALAELDNDIRRERIMAGLAAAKARGRKLGRATVFSDERVAAVRDMLEGGMSMSQVARVTGISRATLYRHQLALERGA